jgi:hypothetical protein
LLGNVEEILAYFLAMTCIVGQKPLPMAPAIAFKASNPGISFILFKAPVLLKMGPTILPLEKPMRPSKSATLSWPSFTMWTFGVVSSCPSGRIEEAKLIRRVHDLS